MSVGGEICEREWGLPVSCHSVFGGLELGLLLRSSFHPLLPAGGRAYICTETTSPRSVTSPDAQLLPWAGAGRKEGKGARVSLQIGSHYGPVIWCSALPVSWLLTSSAQGHPTLLCLECMRGFLGGLVILTKYMHSFLSWEIKLLLRLFNPLTPSKCHLLSPSWCLRFTPPHAQISTAEQVSYSLHNQT